MRLAVHVTPGAARDEVVGWRGRELLLKVSAPPEDGKANAASRALLARELGVGRRAVKVVRGQTSRHKQLEVDGIGEDDVRAAFGAPAEQLP